MLKDYLTTSKVKRMSSNLCFLPFGCRTASSAGLFLNMSRKIGWNFLNVTVETAKFLSRRSTLSRSFCGRLAMSAHFFIFLKNSIRLKEEQSVNRAVKNFQKTHPRNRSRQHRLTVYT